ncbi:uncharacterized protein CIMG_12745 [Coccidioides immitis RS]|uniref:Uncharacterized protein n=1 Tax=Coccidioides immitis (strain RS) TaxID=246410 RepID=A0A0D8JV12_COCIM|nr:uncharacterized protein CIMG_12745 [Coccidioides immitis RS]KJF60103.1 hypothetical protein CIMG_12745 [Coccidioides immitis RS]
MGPANGRTGSGGTGAAMGQRPPLSIVALTRGIQVSSLGVPAEEQEVVLSPNIYEKFHTNTPVSKLRSSDDDCSAWPGLSFAIKPIFCPPPVGVCQNRRINPRTAYGVQHDKTLPLTHKGIMIFGDLACRKNSGPLVTRYSLHPAPCLGIIWGKPDLQQGEYEVLKL